MRYIIATIIFLLLLLPFIGLPQEMDSIIVTVLALALAASVGFLIYRSLVSGSNTKVAKLETNTKEKSEKPTL